MHKHPLLRALCVLALSLAVHPALADNGYTSSASAGSITLGGDVTGAANANTVVAISGASPIAITPATLQWVAATSSPTLSQATSTTGNGQNLLFQSQGPLNAGANVPGSILLNTPAPIGAGAPGSVRVQSGGTSYVTMGQQSNGSTAGAIWLGSGNTSGGTYSLYSTSGGTTLLNGTTFATMAIGGTGEWIVSSTVMSATPPQLSWIASVTAPNVTQLALSSTSGGAGAAGQPLAISAQAGQAATGGTNAGGAGGVLALSSGQGGTSGGGTAGAPGNITLSTPAPAGALAPGLVQVQSGSTSYVQMGQLSNGSSNGAIWGPVTASASNYAMLLAATDTYVNATGTVHVRVNNGEQMSVISGTMSLSALPNVTWGSTLAGTISTSTRGSDLATNNTTISAQSAFATASTNITGGSLILAGGTGATSNATYAPGNVVAQLGVPSTAGTNEGQFEVTVGGTQIASIQRLVGTPTFGALYLSGSGGITPSASNYALATNNSSNITLNGGGSVLLAVAGTTYASLTSALLSTKVPIGGLSGTPLSFSGQTSPNTVACGTGGTQTISAAQSIIPFFLVTTGTLTSNCTVDFSTNASTGFFLLNLQGLGTLGAFGVVLKNGTSTVTISSSTVTNLTGTGQNSLQVATFGTNNLSVF